MEYLLINSKKNTFLVIGICSIAAISLVKDIFHSYINAYHFYFSESILFNTYWILFLPLILVQRQYFKGYANTRFKISASIFLFYFLHLLVFSSIVFFASYLFYGHTYGFLDTYVHTIPESLIPCLMVYGTIAFMKLKSENKNRNTLSDKEDAKKYIDKITVVTQNRNELVRTENIIFIKSETPYILICTNTRSFLYSSTLKSFLDRIDPSIFIRIHRSTVINVNFVASFQSRKNGDYDIKMKNDKIVRVSRNYSTSFKKYFRKSSG